MEPTQKQDAPAATGASQSETVENRQMQPNYTIPPVTNCDFPLKQKSAICDRGGYSTLDAALQYALRGWY
ncbi:MAG: hypothetical protein NTW32_01505, partial [Chloroflexi bacterium]|nr:hypothetical protein [Chloroflexota bacterium]